jgi:two-component system NarL family sensor kinase
MQTSDMALLSIYIIALFIVFVFVLFMAALMVSMVRRQRHDELQRQVEEQARVQAMIQATVMETEKTLTRISHELHNGICEQLLGHNFQLKQLAKSFPSVREPLERAAGTAEAILNQTRALSHNKNSAHMQAIGFLKYLQNRVEELNGDADLKLEYAVQGSFPKLVPETELALIRIVGELILNTRKHAQATHMYVQVDCTDEELHIQIRDNGKGFDMEACGSQAGLGMSSIADYVASIHAEWRLDAAPGKGTTCTIKCPVKAC